MLSLQDVGFVGVAGVTSTIIYVQDVVNEQLGGGFKDTITFSQGGTLFQTGSPVIGKTVAQVEFFFKRVGSPTGTMSFKAVTYDEDGSGTINHTWTPANTDMSTYSTSGEWIKNTDTGNTYTVQTQDVICPYCTNASGGASDYILIQGTSAATANQCWTEANSVEYWNKVCHDSAGIKLYSAAT